MPEAGDEVQTLKAGIMEIADIFVVNKADRDLAEALYRNLRIMAHEKAKEKKEIAVIKTVAINNEGIPALASAIDNFLYIHEQRSEKKIQLLTEKAWQLIQAKRMKGLNKQGLAAALKSAINNTGFNLYSFIENNY